MSVTMTTWTLTQIRDKVRDLTGQLGTANYTDSDIDRYINNYYQYIFTRHLHLDRLITRFQMTINTGQDGRYPIDPEIITIEEPVLIDGSPATLYVDHEEFWDTWPRDTTHDEAEPYDVLLFDRELWFRPPPDDSYTVEVVAKKTPDLLVNDDDAPIEARWGPALAYGAAIDILTDQGDMEAAAEKSLSLQSHLRILKSDWYMQYPRIMRSLPSF